MRVDYPRQLSPHQSPVCSLSLRERAGVGVDYPPTTISAPVASLPPLPQGEGRGEGGLPAQISPASVAGLLPLPQGEGWGEGETNDTGLSFAPLTTPPRIVCVTCCLSMFTACS